MKYIVLLLSLAYMSTVCAQDKEDPLDPLSPSREKEFRSKGMEVSGATWRGIGQSGSQPTEQRGTYGVRIRRSAVITDADVTALESLGYVGEFYIWHDGLYPATYSVIGKLKHVLSISLIGDGVTDEVIAPICTQKGLITLQLDGRFLQPNSLSRLSVLTELTELDITSTELMNPDFLTGVQMYSYQAGLGKFGSLNKLKNLSLTGIRILPGDLQEFTNLKALRYLSIIRSPLRGADVACLQSLDLEHLILRDCRVSDSDAKSLAGFHSLSYLNLSGNPIGDTGVASLPRQINSLKLDRTNLTDAVFPVLAEFKKNDNLFLAGTQITGIGISELVKNPYLTQLDVSDCPLTEEGIQEIGQLKKLRMLFLNGVPITKQQVLSLMSELKELVRLSLVGTGLRDSEFMELKAQAPESLQIISRPPAYWQDRPSDVKPHAGSGNWEK